MRRFAPVLFALLSALFMAERAINGGAFAAGETPVVGLEGIAPLRRGADCLPRSDLLGTLALAGARLAPEPAPFCTDRTGLTDWVAVTEGAGTRHLAFDAQGCLAIWEPAPCE